MDILDLATVSFGSAVRQLLLEKYDVGVGDVSSIGAREYWVQGALCRSNDKRGGCQQRQQPEAENAVHAGLAGGAETKLREGLKDGTKEIRE